MVVKMTDRMDTSVVAEFCNCDPQRVCDSFREKIMPGASKGTCVFKGQQRRGWYVALVVHSKKGDYLPAL